MELIRIIFLCICIVAFHNCQQCRGPGGKMVCCDGEVWNISLQSCQNCSIGFYGPNCTNICPFPAYGKDCQLECRCSKSLCSHVDGCITSNKELSELSTKEFSSQSGSIAPKTSSVAESSTAHVGHFSRKNVDIGQYSATKRHVLSNKTSGVYTSVICLIAISGLFLLLYLGLHCYIKRLQQNHLSSATSAI
ncbi:uncharacterized protein LOC144619691 [Crassostrea virginica]